MDMQKISFIIYEDDGIGIDKAIEYIMALDIPDKVDVEFINNREKCSRFAIYNAAMHQSKAKYKVYMDDSHIILHKEFIKEIMRIFNDDRVGAIGCFGTEQMSTTGIIENSPHLYGRILSSFGHKLEGGKMQDDYHVVQVIGGGVFVTQYDIEWREDLFKGSSYWQEAQSIEFNRCGYKCVVPRQDEFWVLSNKKNKHNEEDKEIFLDEYSKDIYPLVSIVIPTYNRPKYLEIALNSVIHQTYRNLDVFITDDSDNNESEIMMTEKFIHDKRIHYEHHAGFDNYANWNNAMNYDNPKALFINWLMDDDVFALNKIEVMVECFLHNENLSLVTSYRKLIDKDGNVMQDADFNKPIFNENTILNGKKAGNILLKNMNNYIGELSTVLIKKSCLNNERICGVGDKGRYIHADFPTHLDLLTKGDLCYIVEPLSYFRIHDGQDTWTLFNTCNGRICWAVQMMEAIKRGAFLITREEQRQAILYWMLDCTCTMNNVIKENEWEKIDVKNLAKVYTCMAKGIMDPSTVNFKIVGDCIEDGDDE